MRDDDGPVRLGRRRERCLLGLLMLEAGAVVPHAEAYTLNRLATVHCALSRYDEAVERHSEALTLTDRTVSRGPEAEAHLGLATAYLRLGEPGTAQRHATRALTLCRRHGFRLFEGQALLVLAEIG